MVELVPAKVAAKTLALRSGWDVMPVSTSPMTMADDPWVIAQAGSMSMPETTFSTFGVLCPLVPCTETVSEYGARRYHCPDAGPFGAMLVETLFT